MNTSIVTLTIENKTVILVKTAHVSAQSVLDVKETIENYKPSTVCVELDAQRAKAFTEKQSWENVDIISIIKKKQAGFLLTNLILSSYQRKLAKQLDISVGAEMLQAIESAKETGARVKYIDRNIQITFMRIWRSLGFWEKAKLLTALISSMFLDEEITEEKLEELKQSDMIELALKEVGGKFPSIKKGLVDERDQYMAQSIKQAPGDVIVAVIGAAHAPGIIRELNHTHSLSQLDKIPERTWVSKAAGWFIPVSILALILITFSFDSSIGLRQIMTWIILNGGLSALGTALVLGHPLSILTAFVAAPISSLSPLLAAGWFAGTVEAIVRKPMVSDLERISEDVHTLKGFMSNRFLHVLLVVMSANLFSTLGTILSTMEIFRNFFETIF